MDAASAKDKIKVHAGTYQPFVVNKDNLTIREAKSNSDPIVDATGAHNGIEINANGVTLKGLEVQNAASNGMVRGPMPPSSANWARMSKMAAR